MPRLPLPETDAIPEASRATLDGVRRRLGTVPNLFRLLAANPAALHGYLGLGEALSKGVLDPATRERIAIAVAEFNGCGYCLAAHAYLGGKLAGLGAAEIAANRRGGSQDAKAAAAVAFAVEVVRQRGHVGDAALADVRAAGFDDAAILEIVLHVALNTLTNYVNEVAGTEIDFPALAA